MLVVYKRNIIGSIGLCVGLEVIRPMF